MPRSGSLDPLDKFRWKVSIDNSNGLIRAGFSECSAPGVTLNFKEYKEAGHHLNPLLVHEGASFKAITLKRGVISKPDVNDFSKWMNLAFEALKGKQGAVQYRRNMVIEHLDREAKVVKRYVLFNCVPTGYEPASDFSAMDDGSYSLETLTFQYEGFSETTVNGGLIPSATELIRGII